MKTILVLTDFSISANYTADYALAMAQHIGADILLCNVFERPADEDAPDRKTRTKQPCEENSINDLGSLMVRLKSKLDKEQATEHHKPKIACCSVDGAVDRKLAAIAAEHNIILSIISTHSKHNDGGLFQTDHTWQFIDDATFPVMVIPYQTIFRPFGQIAFATGMHDKDIGALKAVSALAVYSNSEVLITHVTAQHLEARTLEHFFNPIPSEPTHLQITYQILQGSNIVRFLKQQFKYVDLLVLIRYKRSFLQNIFSQSVTRKMAAHPRQPLLIYPSTVIN